MREFKQITNPYHFVVILAILLVGLLSGCAESEVNLKASPSMWFKVLDGESSMRVYNKLKDYKYVVTRAPTEEEKKNMRVASSDAAAAGISDPSFRSRVREGKLEPETVKKLESIFTEEKLKEYNQPLTVVAACEKKNNLTIEWHIGYEAYSACWEKHGDKASSNVKEMLDFVLSLKDRLTPSAS